MVRSIGCVAVLLLAGTQLRAGELDAEYGPAQAATQKALGPAHAEPAMLAAMPDVAKAGELDAEAPAQAWGFHRGFGWGGRGFGRGFGWGGWGFGRGFGWGGYGGWGFGRGFGWGGLGYG